MTVDVDEIEGWTGNRRIIEAPRIVPELIARIRELESERDGLAANIAEVVPVLRHGAMAYADTKPYLAEILAAAVGTLLGDLHIELVP